MATLTDWRSLAKPDAEWDQAVQTMMGGQQPDLGLFPTIDSLREWITNAKLAMTQEMEPQTGGVKEHDEEVTMRDDYKITCRVYKPTNPPSGGSPLAVIYHGGGWCIGGLENEELLCRNLATRLGMVSINVDYRLGPEHRFPAAHNDCLDATKWAAANASKLGADPSKGFVIGGTSAGGNMTATIAHQFRDEKIQPAITGCLLMIPAYCHSKYFPDKYKGDCYSWEQNKSAPILSRGAVDLFMNNYIPEEEAGNPIFSPMLWKTGHENLPPSFFQICGQDPLRDEALIFERIMREELGIKTKVEMYSGLPHGFHSVMPQLSSSKKFCEDSVKGVEWLLKQS